MEKIVTVVHRPQTKTLLNETTVALVNFNREHTMSRVNELMTTGEEILMELKEVVGVFERQGISVTLSPASGGGTAAAVKTTRHVRKKTRITPH